MKKLYLLMLFALPCAMAGATNYYVSAIGGNNANSGLTSLQPFATISTAANLTVPGDTVFIMNGTYNTAGTLLNISRSGSATAQIVYTNFAGHTPKLQASPTSYAVVSISPGTSYITISGLEISGNGVNLSLAADTTAAKAQLVCPTEGSPATAQTPLAKYNNHGITADSRSATIGSHHVVISNNRIHDNGASGISFLKTDYITIENNTVFNNSWYTIYGTSGISFNQSYNYDNNTSTYRNFVRNNTSYGNRMYVNFYNDCKVTDGNGIIMDIPLIEYTGKSLVANNLCFGNGGSGIHTFKMNDIDIVHNTTYYNSTSPEINSGEIYSREASNTRIFNNIMVARPTKKVNGIYSSTNLTYNYNIYSGGSSTDLVGTGSLIQDPKFVNPSTDPTVADFHLQSGSVAINNGDNTLSTATDREGTTRPINGKVDIGAYETTLAGPFIITGPSQTKTLGTGNGLGEGSAGYFFGPYESRPATANIKNRRAMMYTQTLLTNNAVPANAVIDSLQFRRAIQTSTTNTTPSTQVVPEHSIVRIYLRNEATDNFGTAAFDWNSILPGAANPAIQVYGGEASNLIGNAGGWKPVALQIPFTYTGGNLAVFIEYLQKGNIVGATDINWIYDNGGSQPLYSSTTYPNQLHGTKYVSSTGTIPASLTINNERRAVMRLGFKIPTVLPVTYQHVSAVKRGNAVVVDWMVSTENNNLGYEVQRSADGVNFENQAFVLTKASNGNSTIALQYSYTDTRPLNGTSYYRLAQKDRDSKLNYSTVVIVRNRGSLVTLAGLYPNPVRDKLTALVHNPELNKVAAITITDMSGQVIGTFKKQLTTGYNTIEIATNRYAAAMYMVEIMLPSGEKMIRRFVKE